MCDYGAGFSFAIGVDYYFPNVFDLGSLVFLSNPIPTNTHLFLGIRSTANL